MITYVLIILFLIILELLYFRIADKFNIIDKPNERSSHSTIVLRGGGIIFLLGLWVWAIAFGIQYPWMLLGVTLAAGISFVDDIRSLPDAVRLVVHFVAMGLILLQLYFAGRANGLFMDANLLVMAVLALAALVVCVGATNVCNFMDGINGITAGYSGVVLLSVLMADAQLGVSLILVHWVYLVVALALLSLAYVVFMKKNYWRHEEYLRGVGK